MITGSYSLIIRCDHPGSHTDSPGVYKALMGPEGWMSYAGESREHCLHQAVKDGWYIGTQKIFADGKCLCPQHFVGSQSVVSFLKTGGKKNG